MLRIYYSQRSAPMITDTVSGLNALASRLREFLASEAPELLIETQSTGSPEPYDVFLRGLRVVKGVGPVLVSAGLGCELTVQGAVDNLAVWCGHFAFPPEANDGEHHHPEYVSRPGYIHPNTLSVIMEIQEEKGKHSQEDN